MMVSGDIRVDTIRQAGMSTSGTITKALGRAKRRRCGDYAPSGLTLALDLLAANARWGPGEPEQACPALVSEDALSEDPALEG
jgi:hypothetical protein